jgi:hypothetical protein
MRVDTANNPKAANKLLKTKMADAPKIAPSNDAPDPETPPVLPEDAPDMDAFKAMCTEIGAYASALQGNNSDFASKLADCMASIQPLTVPTPDGAPAPVKGHPSNPDAHVASPVAAFAAFGKKLVDAIGALDAKMTAKINSVELASRKQMSALGLKPGQAPGAPAPDEGKKKDEVPMTFLELKAKAQKEMNLKPGAAAEHVMKANRPAYAQYLKDLGIYDPAKDPRRGARHAA